MSADIQGLGVITEAVSSICDRTAPVRDALLARVSATHCALVTDTSLGAITGTLDLSVGSGVEPTITELKAGDFAGLTRITELSLNNQGLTHLPLGVFAGLDAVTDLSIDANKLQTADAGWLSDLTSLTILSMEQNEFDVLPDGFFQDITSSLIAFKASRQFANNPDKDEQNAKSNVFLTQSGKEVTLTVPSAAPFALNIPLEKVSGTGSVPANATIETGETTVTLMLSDASTIASFSPDIFTPLIGTTITAKEFGLSHSGLDFVPQKDGICDRSPDFKAALLTFFSASDCSEVSTTTLGELTELDLSSSNINAIALSDLLGMPKLTSLNLSDNRLSTLPGNALFGLPSLTSLDLSGNAFSSLPKDMFDFSFTDTPPSLTSLNMGNQFPNGRDNPPLAAVPMGVHAYIFFGNRPIVKVASGVPADLTLRLDIAGATRDTLTVTVVKGQTTFQRTDAALTASGGHNINLAIAAEPTWPAGTSFTGLTFNTGICTRTPQVQAALRAAVNAGNNCLTVTPTQLAGITGTLDLGYTAPPPASSAPITALKLGDFAGLTNVTTLNLNDNKLTTVPAGVFGELPSLTDLDLSGNEFASLPDGLFAGLSKALTSYDLRGQFRNDTNITNIDSFDTLLTLDLIGTTAMMNMALGAPEDVTATLTLTNATTSTANVTIPAGATSGTVALEASAGMTLAAALPATAPSLTATNTGLTLVVSLPGICNRNTQVRTALLAALSATDCATVSDFSSLTGTLDLSSDATALSGLPAITSLRQADFAGLSALTGLDLAGQSLTGLNPGTFTDLTSIISLDLSGNDLTALAAGTFTGLGEVTTLDLSDNKLATAGLPASIFAPMAKMTSLDLNGNELTALPNSIFAGLTTGLTTKLDVSGQFSNNAAVDNIDSFNVPLELIVDSNEATLSIPTAAPEQLLVPLTLTGHDATSPTSVTIAAGTTSSSATLIPATTGGTVTATITSVPTLSATTTGITLTPSLVAGICDRTAQVRTALLALIGGSPPCATVSSSTLNDLTGTLDLSADATALAGLDPITTFVEGDFEHLVGIQTLDLSDQGLTVLVADLLDDQRLFKDMRSVTDLNLSGNALLALSANNFNGLAALTDLDLSANALVPANVPSRVFAPLSSMTSLDLSDNRLDNLPTGIFIGLATGLTSLDLSNQFGSDGVANNEINVLTLNLIPSWNNNRARIRVPDGVPAELTVTLNAVGATSDTASIVLAPGSTTNLVSLTASGSDPVTLDLASTAWPSGTSFPSLSLDTGICDRTPQVQAALVAAISGANSCNSVTASRLAGLTSLDLSSDAPALVGLDPIAALKTGDFADLSNLTELDLAGQSLTALAAANFTGLAALTDLDLSANQLTAAGLPASTFAALTTLTDLDLSGNQLAALAAANFTGLTAVTDLDLSNSGITTLVAGTFAALTTVTDLDLSGNSLTTLPAGAFTGLTAVTNLILNNNKLADSAASVFMPMTALTDLDIEGNEFDTLPDDFFGGLSNELSLKAGSQFNDNPDSGGSDIATANAKLPVMVALDASDVVTVTLPTRAFAALKVHLTATGATTASPAIAVALAGKTGTQTLTRSNSATPPTVDFADPAVTLDTASLTVTGLTYQAMLPGICSRTVAVQTALLAKVTAAVCADVSDGMLNTISGTLDLSANAAALASSAPITTLKPGDFDDLTSVTGLDLDGQSLATLPDSIFVKLTALQELYLSNNTQLTTSLPATSFATNTALQKLHLQGNRLPALLPGTLTGLTALQELDLSGNLLTAAGLPASAFAALGSLTTVRLNANKLASLPANLFLGMTSDLTTLDLSAQNGNSSSNITVTLKLVLSDAGAQVLLPTGAPTDLNMALTVTNGSANPTQVSISGGGNISGTSTITASGAMIPTIAAALSGSLPAYTAASGSTPASGYGGLTIAAAPAVAQNTGICGRTQQVRDAILADTNGAKTQTDLTYVFCNDIDADHLAAITTLNLSATTPAISTLLAGDFAGLTALQTLDLSDNSISTLPASSFDGLTDLATLDLSGNSLTTLPASSFAGLTDLTNLDLSDNEFAVLPADTFKGVAGLTSLDLSGQTSANTGIILTLRPSINGSNAQVLLPVGAPTDLTVALRATGGTITSNPATVTIAAGATTSSTATIAADNDPATNLVISIPSDPTHTGSLLTGVSWDTTATGSTDGGICQRTEQVRDQLLSAINGSTPSTSNEYVPCFSVTEIHLAAITTLDLSSQTITALKADDFDGLTGLTSLDLSNNSLTGTLAATTFTPLTALQTLDLSGTAGNCTTGNCLTALLSGQFTGLTKLSTLDLSDNNIATLTGGSPFTGLTKLSTLKLGGNALTALPATPFTGSPELADLDLSENKLASLPADLLDGLTKIGTLKLDGNLLTALPAGFFVGTTSLATLNLENQGNDTGETLLAAIPLTLRPLVTGTAASVLLATGAPTTLTLTLSVTDGGSTSNSTAITIAPGATTSSTFTVPNISATVSPNAPTYDSTNFTGLAWVTSDSTSGGAGICGRTVGVQDALLAELNTGKSEGDSGYKLCKDVVTGDLTGLSGTLDLSDLSITTLLSTDFADLTGITTLDLSDNGLTALPAGLFTDLTDLTTLDLSSNAITTLAASGFSTLTKLTSLDLSGNAITALPATPFTGLGELTSLNLSASQLTSLGADAFTGLAKLTTLNLRANQLREAQIDSETLSPLDALTSLDLHGNELTGLPDELFLSVTTLTSLDLRDQFSNDDQTPDLPNVTLSLVPLVQDTTVQVQAPSGAPTDLTVTLAVTEGTLSPTTLTIAAGALTSGNSTLTPDAGAVSNTISITTDPAYDSTNFQGIDWEIAATANPSGGICERTTEVQTALLALVNGATTAGSPGYKACQNIDETDLAALTGTLDLSSAGITRLSASDFADLTGITALTLTGNTGLTGLPTDILVDLSALTTLDLSDNALTALLPNPFTGLTALTSIDLSGNALTALPALSSSSLTALTSLDLRNNAIASLAGSTLSPFATTLTTLHLQGNELTALPDGFFRGATALTTLNAGLQTSTDADISLTLEPVFDGGELRLLLPTGAPMALTMNVATSSGTLTPTSLTIAAGATLSSGASTLSYSGAAPTVSISSDPTVANTITLTGLAWNRSATAVPTDGICGRTAQVGDALLALINGDTVLGDAGYVACRDATASLASLTGTLDLSSASITALKDGDFDGLTALTGIDLSDNTLTTLAADLLSAPTALTSLDLSDNRIATLPDGFFSGVTSLTSLDLSGQDHDGDSGASTPVQGISLAIRPILSGDKISLLLPTGAPTGLTVPLATTGGTATPSTLRFAAGDTLSNQATFIAVDPSSLSIGVARAPTYNAIAFAGLLWDISATLDPGAGICSRTGAVKDALVALVNGATTAGAPGYKYCQDIVAGDLTALTGELDLNAAGVSQLSNGDFADLSGITGLDLGGNSLVRLDANTFTGLSALTSLDLSNNSLTYLVADSLAGLPTTLTTLTMSGNTTLTRLPSGLFSTLTGLTSLDLSGNALASLPISPFTTLASLDTLSLQNNSLTRVTVSVFSGLAALTTLNMQGNDMDQFPSGVLAPLSALEILNLRGNDLTGLPDGFFAGLTTLTTLDLSDQVSVNTNLAIALTPIYLSAAGKAQVRIATGAPVALSVVLTPYAGGTALATQTLSIPAGATLSGPSTALPPTAAELGIAPPTIDALSDVEGVTWTVPDADSRLNLSSGICGRQSAVLTALLAALNTDKSAGDSGYLYCQDVAGTDLSSLTSLSLTGVGSLTGLTADDFTDLDSLTSLTLTGDTSLTSLPSGLFAGLGALTTLDLSGNALTTLAAADFAGLTGLTSLNLRGNKLASLPDGFFAAMPALTALDLSGQDHDNDPSTDAQDITLTLTPEAADLQVVVQLLTGAPTALDITLTATGGTLTLVNPAPAQSASQSAGQPSAQSAVPAGQNAIPAGQNAIPTLPNAVPAAGQTATVRIAAGSTTSPAVLFTSDTDPNTDPQVTHLRRTPACPPASPAWTGTSPPSPPPERASARAPHRSGTRCWRPSTVTRRRAPRATNPATTSSPRRTCRPSQATSTSDPTLRHWPPHRPSPPSSPATSPASPDSPDWTSAATRSPTCRASCSAAWTH